MPFEVKNPIISAQRYYGGTIGTDGLFAIDSRLLFFKANWENALVIKEVLQTYCQASGQRINMEKSSIHFANGGSNVVMILRMS